MSTNSKQAVSQLKDGNVLAVYDSRHAASSATDTDIASIRKVCRGTRRTAGGYQWENVSMNEMVTRTSNMIIQKDIDGVVVGLYDTIQRASEVSGIKTGYIKYAVAGKRKIAGGYHWI